MQDAGRYHFTDRAREFPLSPLSFQQQFYRHMHSGSDLVERLDGAHALCISGPLDLEVLHKSLEALIRRHDALRTRIVMDEGIPKQYVETSSGYQLEIVSLADGPTNGLDIRARATDLVPLHRGSDRLNGAQDRELLRRDK